MSIISEIIFIHNIKIILDHVAKMNMLRVWLDAQQYLSAALRTVSYHKILSGDAFFMIMIFPASLHRLMLFNSLICFSIFERFETIRNILIVYFYT